MPDHDHHIIRVPDQFALQEINSSAERFMERFPSFENLCAAVMPSRHQFDSATELIIAELELSDSHRLFVIKTKNGQHLDEDWTKDLMTDLRNIAREHAIKSNGELIIVDRTDALLDARTREIYQELERLETSIDKQLKESFIDENE